MNTYLRPKKFVALLLASILFLSSTAQVWTKFPTPNPGPNRNILRGISGTSSSDIWTVGYYEPDAGSGIFRNLILHWNGSTWQQFTTSSPSPTLNDLYDVEAVSTNEVWAAGTYTDGNAAKPQLLKWNGASWNFVSIPNVPSTAAIWSLDAISANDVWAVGATYTNAYALHYDGTSWTQVHVPLVGLVADIFNAVHGIASNDVWAVGSYRNMAGQFRFMARHWDGATWTNTPMPASVSGELGELLDVRMISSNDVWAIGSILTGGIVKLHWDGNVWTEVTPPAGGGGALAPLSSNNVFSVGNEIARWNGSTWTVVDPLSNEPYPALRNAYVAPNGDIWAAGRTVEGTNIFKTLIYRTATDVPAFSAGTSQSTVFPTNSGGNSIDQLLQTANDDVSQVLTYSVVTPPAHGTLGGFPDTAVTNNGIATPTGLTYTPNAGYSGPDQFTVQVSVGSLSAQTTITANVSSVLPVTLALFNGQYKNNTVLLSWQTSREWNATSFTIERSINGRHFEAIASMPAANIAGGSYRHTDQQLPASANVLYYRLKINDKDGRHTYSNITAVATRSGESVVILYPNPATTSINAMISVGKKQQAGYSIINQSGHVVASGTTLLQEGSNTLLLNVTHLAAGQYTLQVKGSSIQKQIKFVKQ